jgi:hypothetical protein
MPGWIWMSIRRRITRRLGNSFSKAINRPAQGLLRRRKQRLFGKRVVLPDALETVQLEFELFPLCRGEWLIGQCVRQHGGGLGEPALHFKLAGVLNADGS